MSNRLAGRTALVTGAGRGIGQHVAARFAGEGARVVFADRDLAAAEAAADAFPHAIAVGMDISDEGSVAAGFAAVTAHGWEIDVVVANAGVQLFGQDAKIADLDLDVWNRTVAINLTGTFLTVKHALPLLRAVDASSVVITSSVNGTRMFSNSGASAYAASKAGQVAFAKMIAVELAADRIRVNVICPGAIDTEIGDNTEQRGTENLRLPVEYPQGQIPLTGTEPGTSDQVADLVCFLASDAASHITGTEVWIDGAQSLLAG